MMLALAIYAVLATVAGVVCALGWRWQSRLTDRVLDLAEEAQEHAAACPLCAREGDR